jgi:4-hydroxy-4-methyl-2-oxoglutarate aldolase
MRSLNRLLKEFNRFSICQLADGLGPACVVETELKPVHSEFRICGPAMTVSCSPGDNLTLHHALHLARAGLVLVASDGGRSNAALWGGLMSLSAKQKGLKGTIVDGAARDLLEIRRIGYPVFSRATKPLGAAKEDYGRLNIPIRCGSLRVNPGDIVFADANGIIAVPRAQLELALAMALRVLRRETGLKRRIKGGRTLFESLELGSRVHSKKAGTRDF